MTENSTNEIISNTNDASPDNPEWKSQKDRVRELTDKLEAGVQSVFESENYKQYLKCMSKFHRYSINNSLLIAMQCPNATLVAGYQAWEKNHGRHVRKGEKGIRILAPCKYKVDLDEKDENDAPKTIERTGFKVSTVFDISQTYGRDLPAFGIDELTGTVEDYEKIFNTLAHISPVPIHFEDIRDGAKGYYNDAERFIAIRTGMSEAQTIKTCLHEISHAVYHSRAAMDKDRKIDRSHMETEAESIAFCVGNALKIVDSSEYSFPYLASWASGRDTKELKDSLERIRSAADEMINAIEQDLAKQQRREPGRSRDDGR